jgi:hypothetical protein
MGTELDPEHRFADGEPNAGYLARSLAAIWHQQFRNSTNELIQCHEISAFMLTVLLLCAFCRYYAALLHKGGPRGDYTQESSEYSTAYLDFVPAY